MTKRQILDQATLVPIGVVIGFLTAFAGGVIFLTTLHLNSQSHEDRIKKLELGYEEFDHVKWQLDQMNERLKKLCEEIKRR